MSNTKLNGGNMTRIKAVLTVMAVLFLPIFATAGNDNPWERKLPFENATINYTLSGNEQGTETLYIRDYGKETATYHKTTTTMMGRTVQNDTVLIQTPDWMYTFDLVKKTGKKNVNPQKYMIEEYNKLSSAEKSQVMKNAQEMGTTMAKGMGGKIEKNVEKILGFDCDRATVMGTTVSSIHETGIPLKSDTNMMGISMKKEAKDVNKGSIDAKYFQHPAGITPQADPEGDDMSRSMAQQTVTMLKDPEGAKKAVRMNPMLQQKGKNSDQQDEAPEISDEEMEQAMKALKGMQKK
jgi:hypothetical protein